MGVAWGRSTSSLHEGAEKWARVGFESRHAFVILWLELRGLPLYTNSLDPPSTHTRWRTRSFFQSLDFFYNSIYNFVFYLFTTPHARGVLKRGCSPSPTLDSRLSFSLLSPASHSPLTRLSRHSPHDTLSPLVSRLSSLSPTHTTGLSLLSSLKLASLVSRLSRLSLCNIVYAARSAHLSRFSALSDVQRRPPKAAMHSR